MRAHDVAPRASAPEWGNTEPSRRPAVEPTPALELVGLSKWFGATVAADGVDLVVPRGSFFGLVGPNGAGKTTSLSMAVGLLRPDGGTARVLGHDVWADPEGAKALIGVLPDALMLPERLTGRELLTYVGLLRKLSADQVVGRTEELLTVLGLADARETLVIEYSSGMRKKIGLAAALLHAPGLLVLDEPFEAVDPVSASTIRTILGRFVGSGGTVIFSSHVMALVEQLCTHVAVIARGRVLAAARSPKSALGAAWTRLSSSSSARRSLEPKGLRGWRPDPAEARDVAPLVAGRAGVHVVAGSDFGFGDCGLDVVSGRVRGGSARDPGDLVCGVGAAPAGAPDHGRIGR